MRRERPDERLNDDSFQSDSQTQSAVFDQAWARLVVREAYERLLARSSAEPHAVRRMRVLQLRYQDGLPPRRIAARLELDVADVYQMLSTGKSQFRRALAAVMTAYHPSGSRGEIDDLCRELLDLF